MRRDRRLPWLRLASVTTTAAFLHLTLTSALPALAAPKPGAKVPRVVFVPLEHSSDVRDLIADRIEEYINTLLSMSSRLEVVGEAALKQPLAPEEEAAAKPKGTPAIEAADDQLWKGKELLQKKKYRTAIDELDGAVRQYERHFEELRDYDKLVDAYLQLAIAYYRAGFEDNGEEMLAKVVVMRPDLVLDARQFSSGVKEAADRLKARYQKIETGEVRIESPTAGSVYLDGVLQGATPINLKGLFPGTHYVQVFADGFAPWAQRLQTPQAGKRDVLTAALTADASAPQPQVATPQAGLADVTAVVANGRFHDGFAPKARAVADKAKSGYLFMGYVSRNGDQYVLTPFLFSADLGATAELQEVVFDDQLTNLQVNLLVLEDHLMAALTSFPHPRTVKATPAVYTPKPAPAPVVAIVPTPSPTPTPVVPTPAPTPTPTPIPVVASPALDPDAPVYDPNAPVYDPTKPYVPPRDDSSPWYEKWWVWTIVGAAVVGGAVTAGVLLAPQEQQTDRFSVRVEW